MKKNFLIILIFCVFFISCSKAPKKSGNLKGGSAKSGIYIPKGSSDTVKEKKELQYSAFKAEGLPLPINNYGKTIEYLVPVAENDDIDFSLFKKYNENKVLDYYKNLKVRGLGDNSSYWRWKTSIRKSDLYSKIPIRIVNLSKNNYRNIFTLENGNWVQKPITKVGTVKNIKVMARGASGIITHLLIETTYHKYLVTKEYVMRRLLATNSPLYGAKGGADGYITSKDLVSSVVSLPSAHLAFEEKNGRIDIYGAGFGHGAGMPQFAASSLAQRGKNYENILKRYYKGSKLVNVSKILGKNTEIKVGITGSGGNLNHRKLSVSSGNSLRVYNSDIDLTFKKNEKVSVINKNGKVQIISPKGKSYITNKPLNFNAKGYYLSLSPVVKAHTSSPKYRGILTISAYGSSSLRVINTVDIEKYLLQVVPSEMPRSFGLEALKAQAVAARTYAVSDIQKQKYIKDGFHIKDTIESQVYNNQVENEDATKAIEETKNKILIYDGVPIDAKYFSTSAGFTSFSSDIW
ncbi:MAG: SpoIID/LytB domain-containing protein [Fusobacterium sp.]|nr:SpoIID/LytB domain-containing protein [Fusobacterium sp.]